MASFLQFVSTLLMCKSPPKPLSDDIIRHAKSQAKDLSEKLTAYQIIGQKQACDTKLSSGKFLLKFLQQRHTIDHVEKQFNDHARSMDMDVTVIDNEVDDLQMGWSEMKNKIDELERQLNEERERNRHLENVLLAFLSEPNPTRSSTGVQTDVNQSKTVQSTAKQTDDLPSHRSILSQTEPVNDRSVPVRLPSSDPSHFAPFDQERQERILSDQFGDISPSDPVPGISELPQLPGTSVSSVIHASSAALAALSGDPPTTFSAVDIDVDSMDDLVTVDGSGFVPELGRGAYGTVYLYLHAATGRPVALKVIDMPDRLEVRIKAKKEFMREVNTHTALGNVEFFPRFYGQFKATENQLAIAMEFVGDDTTLMGCSIGSKLVGRAPELSEFDWLDVLMDVANGLRAMHGAGFLMNDLHENNVLLIENGGKWRGKIIDFGMSSSGPTELNMSESARRAYIDDGKYSHYAPECALHDVPTSIQSDTYQLGSLMGLVGQEMSIGALITIGECITTVQPDKRPALGTILEELELQRYGIWGC